ncbi:conserved hypothetical protein [Trichinella spiralis]|uniref:hypothetical protein n=1 Tax=Trichinella spiralis TaxID=6334 RepID=UPI0001EFDCA7|nr:conserved hypothetical protein [Trichinella spiralis]
MSSYFINLRTSSTFHLNVCEIRYDMSEYEENLSVNYIFVNAAIMQSALQYKQVITTNVIIVVSTSIINQMRCGNVQNYAVHLIIVSETIGNRRTFPSGKINRWGSVMKKKKKWSGIPLSITQKW